MAHITTILKPGHPVGELENLCRQSKERCGIGEVLWLTTFRCNLRCSHCYTTSPRDMPELNTKEAVEFIHHLGVLGVPMVFLSGGEPLLRKDIEVILKELHGIGIKVILSTNGTLITPEVARLIKDTGVLYLAVSLYGPQEVHDGLTRTEGAFDRIVKGIEILKDYEIPMCIKTVVTEITYPYIIQVVDFGISSGIKAFYICDLVPAGRGCNAPGGGISRQEWLTLLDKLVSYVETEDIFLDIGAHPSTMPFVIEKISAQNPDKADVVKERLVDKVCPVGEGFVGLMPDGGVSPCNFMPDLILGNIREKPIEEIINSFNESFSVIGEPCASCKWKDVCGGCRAKAFYMLGDARKGDPSCLLYGNS